MVDIEKLKKRRNVGGLIKALKDEVLYYTEFHAMPLKPPPDASYAFKGTWRSRNHRAIAGEGRNHG